MTSSISKVAPKDPSSTMVIRSIHPSITTLSTPFARAGHFAIGGRATLVRLGTGTVAVFSPVSLTSDARSAIDALTKTPSSSASQVGYIVAPDAEHHMFISEWKKAFPAARIIGPRTLHEKRRKQAASGKNPNVTDDAFFKELGPGETATGDPTFDSEFDMEVVEGTPNKEIAFLHKASKTLIQADLIFNLPAKEQYSRVPEKDRPREGFTGLGPLGNWIFNRIGTTEGNMTWPRRFVWYGLAAKNREGFNKSIRRIDGWNFENVVPCHGETILGDGKERFRRLFAWHLHDKKE